MRFGRLALLGAGVAAAVLASWALLTPLLPSVLSAPAAWLTDPTLGLGLASAALLASDVVLPVPSSIVMMANGAVFGLAGGALVSTVGATVSAILGYALGRTLPDRARSWLGEEELARLDALMTRHLVVILLASRPVPILAEVVAVLAGTARVRLGAFAAAAAVGSLVTGATYAAASTATVGGHWPLALGVALAGAVWFAGRDLTRSVGRPHHPIDRARMKTDRDSSRAARKGLRLRIRNPESTRT